MKKQFIISTLLCLLLGSNDLLAQDAHESLELFFQEKTLVAFATDLQLTTSDYEKQSTQEFIDIEYQKFFSVIKTELDKEKELTQFEFEQLYKKYILLAQNKFKKEGGSKGDHGIPIKTLNGPCLNMDFETGDLTGWELTRGFVNGASPYSYTGEYTVGPGAYHSVFGPGTDPITGIPTNNPLGGNSSVRLGNGTGIGAQAARMRQSFMVDSSNYLYVYSYAVIFESPVGHTLNELPYFTVRVFNSNGNSVPCGEYSVIADAANAAGYQSVVSGGVVVLYKNWQTVFANLGAYIGQNVTVEFTSGDCSRTGHYGYAYVDATCNVDRLTASNDLICTGDSATLTAPPGAASYSWSNGGTGPTTVVYTGGTYTCTLTPFAGGGCDVTLDIAIADQPTPVANFTTSASQICNLDSLYLTDLSTIASPGTIANYRWNFGDGVVSPISNGNMVGVAQSTGTYTAPAHQYTSAGTFNVNLYVESADGCIDSLILPVTINPLPPVVATPNQAICDGASVTLSGSGANTYIWDNGVSDGVAFVPSVGVHSYSVIGTDVNGCSDTALSVVTVNALPLVSAGSDQDVCAGESVTLSGSLSSGYSWDNGVTDGVPFTPAVGSIDYTVTVTSAANCVNSDLVNVTVNPVTTVDAGPAQEICSEEQVALSANMTNGTNPQWSGGTGTFDNFQSLSPVYTPSSSDISAGTVRLYFSAENPYNCPTVIDSVDISINHFAANITTPTTDITCFGDNDGTVNVIMISPNNGPFTYSLDNNSPVNTSYFDNLTPGNHMITITNTIGCDTVLNFVINEPPLLVADFTTVQNITCNAGSDGQLAVTTTGGTPNYTIVWTGYPNNSSTLLDSVPAGSYSVTITDANQCTLTMDTTLYEPSTYPQVQAFAASPICYGQSVMVQSDTTQSQSPLWFGGNGIIQTPNDIATNYMPTNAEFQNGSVWLFIEVSALIPSCPGAIDSVQVILNMFNGQPVLTSTNVTCNGLSDGEADVVMNNLADGPFTFSLDNAPASSSSYFTGLGIGSHSVLIQNANGCDTTLFFEIYEPPTLFINSLLVQDPACFGDSTGRIEIAAFGGNGSYTYQWTYDPTNNSPLADSLTIGNYSLTVLDSLGCSAVFDTMLFEPNPLNQDFVYDSIACFGDLTQVSSSTTGGTIPYSYQWSNGSNTSSTLADSGQLSLQILDAHGCLYQDTVDLVAPPLLRMTSSNDTTVCRTSIVELFAYPVGGTSPYNYQWSNAPLDTDDSTSLQIQQTQTVSVVVTDARGCVVNDQILVNVFQSSANDFNTNTPTRDFCENDSVLLNYSYTGNVPIQAVGWLDCSTCGFPRIFYPNSDTLLSAYLVTICNDTLWRHIPINIVESPDFSFLLPDTVLCPNEPTVMNPTGLSGVWGYVWELGDGTFSTLSSPIISYPNSGFYLVQLTVTDPSSGCTYSSSGQDTIEVLPQTIAQFTVDRFRKTIFDPTFHFRNQSINAVAYEWNFGDGGASIEIDPSHTYEDYGEFFVELIAYGANGCNDSIIKMITIVPDFNIYIPNTFTPDGDRYNNSFGVKGFGLINDGFHLLIFNRWGEIVFETFDIYDFWDGTQKDGKLAQDGTYTWKVSFKDLEGTTHMKVGHVNILR